MNSIAAVTTQVRRIDPVLLTVSKHAILSFYLPFGVHFIEPLFIFAMKSLSDCTKFELNKTEYIGFPHVSPDQIKHVIILFADEWEPYVFRRIENRTSDDGTTVQTFSICGPLMSLAIEMARSMKAK